MISFHSVKWHHITSPDTGIIFIHGFITLRSTLTVGRQIKKKYVLPYCFLLCLILYLSAISKCKTRGGLYSEGRFHKGIFSVTSLRGGSYIWRRLFSEFYAICETDWLTWIVHILPASLVLKEHFFCILSVLTRLMGIIGTTETKESFFLAAIYAFGLCFV